MTRLDLPCSVADCAATVGGEVRLADGSVPEPGAAQRRVITALAVDSRQVSVGAIFAALPGERTDGHKFVADAAAAGAACAMVSVAGAARVGPAGTLPLVIVPDVLAALQALATARRRALDGLVAVGITGSNAKTTAKEMLASILARRFSTFRTRGNLNSDIGIPISVFEVPADAEVGVFEMAMNRPGEMAELAAVVRPDHALITNIGTAHIGMIGSQDAIAAEKKAVASAFTGSQTLYVPAQDAYAGYLSSDVKGRVVSYSDATIPGFRGWIDRGLDGITLVLRDREVPIPVIGLQNSRAVAGAVAVAVSLGCSMEEIAEGLASVVLPFGRGEVIRGEVTIIRDCYNASPESVRAAVDHLAALPWQGRKHLVLGSMLELGSHAHDAHRDLAAPIRGAGLDGVFLFGEETAATAEALASQAVDPAAVHTTDLAVLGEALRRAVKPGDLVLLKGSRGMALERLVEVLQEASVQGGRR